MNLLKFLPYFIYEKIITSKKGQNKSLCTTNNVGTAYYYNEEKGVVYRVDKQTYLIKINEEKTINDQFDESII